MNKNATAQGRLAVGWYGRPGIANSSTKVHLAGNCGPVCGAKPHLDAEFQWCSWDNFDWLECIKCREIAATRLRKRANALSEEGGVWGEWPAPAWASVDPG